MCPSPSGKLRLFVEILGKGLKFATPQHATAPPGPQETATVAQQLHVGGHHGNQPDGQAVVAAGGIGGNNQGKKQQGRRTHRHQPAAAGAAKGQDQPQHKQQHQQRAAHGEHGRQQMDELKRTGVALGQIDARNAGIVDLAEKLAEVHAPLVPHPRLGQQAAGVAAAEEARAQVDVLAKAHPAEAFQLAEHVAPHAHVEGARIELVEFLLAAAYAAGGEERGHGIVDGLLHGRKVGMCAVGAAKGVARLTLQLLLDMGEVVGRQHHVGIQNNQVLAPGMVGGKIARLTGPGIGLGVVVQLQAVGIGLHAVGAGQRGAVVHHNHLKVGKALVRQALQQFLHLVGAVVHGYEYGIFHRYSGISMINMTLTGHHLANLQKKRETARSAGRTLTKRLAPAVLKMLNSTSITLGNGIFIVSLLTDLRSVACSSRSLIFLNSI